MSATSFEEPQHACSETERKHPAALTAV